MPSEISTLFRGNDIYIYACLFLFTMGQPASTSAPVKPKLIMFFTSKDCCNETLFNRVLFFIEEIILEVRILVNDCY